jgi:hypothetical protein
MVGDDEKSLCHHFLQIHHHSVREQEIQYLHMKLVIVLVEEELIYLEDFPFDDSV